MKLHRILLTFALVLAASRVCLGSALVGLLFDTANYEIADRNGVILPGGLRTIDHDGTVVQIGYYDFFAWIPLTGEGSLNLDYAHTTIGDAGFVDDRFFNGRFSDGWEFEVGNPTTGQSLPPTGTVLYVRFYDATSLAAARYYAEVWNPAWQWPQPSPSEPVLDITLADSGTQLRNHGLLAPYGVDNGYRIRTDLPLVPDIPEPAALSLLATGVLRLIGRRR